MAQCPKCAAQIADAEDYCGRCFAPVERPSWWRRFLGWLYDCPVQYEVRFSGTQRVEHVDPATGQRRIVHSLEELPAEIRSQLDDLQRKALAGEGTMAFTFRDMSGRDHTYHSVEEMPPEIRQLFEQARRVAQLSPETLDAPAPPKAPGPV